MSIFGAQHDDGTVTLMVVNRGDADVVAPLNVANYPSTGSGEVRQLSCTVSTLNTMLKTWVRFSIAELELPGQSISLYVLPSSQ